MKASEELKKEIQKLQSLLNAKKYLETLEKQIYKEEQNIILLEKIIDSEYKDIQLLESMSFNLVLKKIFGDKSNQIEKEKQEYLQVFVKHKNAVKSLEVLKFKETVLREKMQYLPIQKSKINDLVRLREDEISPKDSGLKSKLLQLFQLSDECIKHRAELDEVKTAGINCLKLISELSELFKKASKYRSWKYFNRVIGYSREKAIVENALGISLEFKIELERFEIELLDIDKKRRYFNLNTIQQMDSFAEKYYNYLVNDWIILSRFDSIIAMFDKLYIKIDKLLITILEKEEKNEEKIEKIELQQNILVLKQ